MSFYIIFAQDRHYNQNCKLVSSIKIDYFKDETSFVSLCCVVAALPGDI
jgi:hypothetical protein